MPRCLSLPVMISVECLRGDYTLTPEGESRGSTTRPSRDSFPSATTRI
jgi:hypothetical protein